MNSSANILIVDDEYHVRASLEEMLTRDGFRVDTVESGEKALACIVGKKYDLALIDIKLGGIGGMDVLAQIRQQSPETEVIVLTGHASLETAIETLRRGAHDYIFKPAKPAELRDSIHRGLFKRREQRQRTLLAQLDRLAARLEEIRTAVQLWNDESISIFDQPEGQVRFMQKSGLFIDLVRHVVTLEGRLVKLSYTEFEMLTYLVKNSPRVVSPRELVSEVLGYQSEPWEAKEVVRQHIYHLRQKFREIVGRRDIIRTVRGVGYTIDE
ncbi:MAG: response regulator transcription factor [Anaerolineales bacterium]|nr:response regulator transcription factor [Anaerolineales bacterium]